MAPSSRSPLTHRLLAAVLAAACSIAVPARAALDQAALNALFDGSRPPRAGAVRAKAADDGLEAWLVSEKAVSLKKMFANISPAGAAPGSVAASPSHENPNYWYNWKRDAALTMSEVVSLYRGAADAKQKKAYLKTLLDYAAYARGVQGSGGLTGIGEPKSNMDGTPFNGPWGRPQDDGPAEEASTLTALANAMLAEGRRDVAVRLYGDFTAGIKGDLEYVSHHWAQTSFDVWEEVKAHHFDTAMAQRSALLEGAGLARRLGDPGAADWYESQARLLEAELAKHWDAEHGIIRAETGRDGGLDYKSSGLDTAVILAAIRPRAAGAGELFSVTDKRVLATAQALKEAFKSGYALNRRPDAPGVAIGRYPEDKYFGGNPWVLGTDAFAQLYFMAASAYLRRGAIPVEAEDLAFFRDLLKDADRGRLAAGMTVAASDPLFARLIAGLKEGGDGYLRVVRAHADPDGALAEQIDRESGYMTSARDLTWNYASVLSALAARDELLRSLRLQKAK